jgi:ArsR family transcriptional regulator
MEKTVELLKAIADETRLKIILLLSRQEMAVCEFINALKLSQPAVSHHLKILKQAGLVKDNREGKWIFYTIDHQKFKDLGNDLENKLFLPIREYYKKGTLPSRIRLEPCLCEELKQEAVKGKVI